jgi:hypothetical protein
MYDFVRDGRFFKNTKGRGGRPLECEVVQCRCGAWASTKLVNTPHHLGSADHREWATTHGETLVLSYRKHGKSESEGTESSSPVSTATPDLDTVLLTEANKPRSPLCPQWYADEEGVWIDLGVYEDNANVVDGYFKDFQTYRISEDTRYAKVHDARQELRCRDNNPFRSGKEVFFHHSEVSLEGLVMVMENGDMRMLVPASNKECVERLYRFHVLKEVLKESWDKYRTFFDEDEMMMESKKAEYNAFVASMKSIVDGKVGLMDHEEAKKQQGFPKTREECALNFLMLDRLEYILVVGEEKVEKGMLSLVL